MTNQEMRDVAERNGALGLAISQKAVSPFEKKPVYRSIQLQTREESEKSLREGSKLPGLEYEVLYTSEVKEGKEIYTFPPELTGKEVQRCQKETITLKLIGDCKEPLCAFCDERATGVGFAEHYSDDSVLVCEKHEFLLDQIGEENHA